MRLSCGVAALYCWHSQEYDLRVSSLTALMFNTQNSVVVQKTICTGPWQTENSASFARAILEPLVAEVGYIVSRCATQLWAGPYGNHTVL